MGKRIISRARGHGGPRYRAPSHRYAGTVAYPAEGTATVIDIVHDTGRDAPLALVKDQYGKETLVIAAEGVYVGKKLNFGVLGTQTEAGMVLPLSAMPKGSFVFAIELTPRGGPKMCCSAGTRAQIVTQEPKKVIIQLPSKHFKELNPDCWATFGIPGGSGRGDKPFVKAGQVYWASKARNRLWPRSSANKMNPVDHPFGGHTKPGTPKTISTWAPPGAKVGSIGARRTGRRKK
jgi:large subunit ribosomal protein L2